MSDRVAKIGIEEIFEAATAGVLRGMKAREISTERLVASGENQTEESAAIRGILRVCGSIAGFHLSNSLH